MNPVPKTARPSSPQQGSFLPSAAPAAPAAPAADEEDRGGRPAADSPLAVRMRPRTLDEFAGQEHLLAPGKPLRRSIEEDRLGSIVLWGPPGTGKTTLALLIARTTRAHFASLSAVTDGVADLRRVIEDARKRRRGGGETGSGQRTVLLVDEVHRWSKSQQDALLPFVEDGTIILVGATTENPYFDVIAPLRSRLRIFRFEPLSDEAIRSLVLRALADADRGLGGQSIALDPEALPEERLRVAVEGTEELDQGAINKLGVVAGSDHDFPDFAQRRARTFGVDPLT